MSWMDSWSRPNKHQATPVPFYLLPGGDDVPYCKSCGRVINSRKSAVVPTAATGSGGNQKKGKGGKIKKQDQERVENVTQPPSKPGNEVRYCSSRCRNQKPGRLDREIEDAFLKFLTGEELVPETKSNATTTSTAQQGKPKKGDGRILVGCDAVEEYVFGGRRKAAAGADAVDKSFGRKKNRASRVIPPQEEGGTESSPRYRTGSSSYVDDLELEPPEVEIDPDVLARMSIRSGTRVRPPQTISEVNGSVGGEKGWAERITETDEMKEKRMEGQQRSHEKEMVRSGARRGVVFGFVVAVEQENEKGQRKMCEAVMQGKVVEPSFAKGDWGVRWRE